MVDKVAKEQAEEEQEKPFDTSDPEQVNTARKKEARKRSDRLRFIAAAMDTKEGRAWFYDFLNFNKVFGNVWDSDPYRTAFLCGQQNAAKRLLDDILTANEDQYLTMMKENRYDRNNQ